MLKKIDWDNQIGRRLRLRDLHVLFVVAQQGSMAKAAARLGVSAPTVSEIVANLEHSATAPSSGRQDFFVRKAIGWALRDAGSHQPGWVRQFVAVHRDALAGLSIREALKHLG